MPATKTLTQMLAITRELADQENSTFVDDTELTARINEACSQLYDMLVQARGSEYYATSVTSATVASQALYTFVTSFSSTDVYRIVSVMIDDGSYYVSVPRFEYSELPALRTLESSLSASLWLYRYRAVPTGIELRPQPTTTGHTLTLHYIPTYTLLSSGSDTFDGINGWEKWACLQAAIDCLNKEESDPSALMAQRGHIEQQIKQLAPGRDINRPQKVSDTRQDYARLRYSHARYS